MNKKKKKRKNSYHKQKKTLTILKLKDCTENIVAVFQKQEHEQFHTSFAAALVDQFLQLSEGVVKLQEHCVDILLL